jgi:hypothetical protein
MSYAVLPFEKDVVSELLERKKIIFLMFNTFLNNK